MYSLWQFMVPRYVVKFEAAILGNVKTQLLRANFQGCSQVVLVCVCVNAALQSTNEVYSPYFDKGNRLLFIVASNHQRCLGVIRRKQPTLELNIYTPNMNPLHFTRLLGHQDRWGPITRLALALDVSVALVKTILLGEIHHV